MFSLEQWTRSIAKMKSISFNKNDVIFEKGTILEPLKIAVILSTDAICNE